MIEAATRLFGLSPDAFCKWAPRGWDLTFRDVGRLRYAGSPGRGRVSLVVDDFPRDFFLPHMIEAARRTLSSIITLTQVQGDVQVVSTRAADGMIALELRWRPRDS